MRGLVLPPIPWSHLRHSEVFQFSSVLPAPSPVIFPQVRAVPTHFTLWASGLIVIFTVAKINLPRADNSALILDVQFIFDAF